MTPDQLDQRLREKLPAVSPRPGFETRLQALAREPDQPKKASLRARLALPALALVILALIFVPTPNKQPASAPSLVDSNPNPAPRPKIEGPVSREYEGLKNDARWTLSLVRSTVPSIPVSMKKSQ